MVRGDLDGEKFVIAGGLARLAREFVAADGVTETAETAVEHAVAAVGATAAGLLVSRAGSPVSAVATDAGVTELQEVQTASGEGPLMETSNGDTTIWIRDAAAETRWPSWRDLIGRLELRTVLHIPLLRPHSTIGVLSFYHAKPDAFTEDDVVVADLIARHAAIALATARTEATLVQAADARRLVGQAMGILMERHDIDDQQAFAVLRRYSQDTNTKLREVAIQLIETRRLPR